ncbi:hypothetical protein A3K80_07790 [Candidatus Bathyarchaeota archaeon RBG_13_38_9]|nr:MAG: hypothetical protein A3K80_07790 [Candidatus Bathyarchaeota archaeon RBG_13_38_9]
MKPIQKRCAIIQCPRCEYLQLIYLDTKSHRCVFCESTIKMKGSRVKILHISKSPRDASMVLMKLKQEKARSK